MENENKNSNNIGFWFLLAAVVFGLFVYSGLKKIPNFSLIQYESKTDNIPIYPCDIFPDYLEGIIGEDWCQPYIDYGYNNGLVMAKRIISEREMIKSLPGSQKDGWTPVSLTECRQIIDDIYDQAKDKTNPVFPTKNRILK